MTLDEVNMFRTVVPGDMCNDQNCEYTTVPTNGILSVDADLGD